MVRVAIYGITGYTGLELYKVLRKHREVKVVSLISRSHKGKRLKEVFPFLEEESFLEDEPSKDFDLAFLCLPLEESYKIAPKLLKVGKRVIDLSPAFRLKDKKLYLSYYSFEHNEEELLKDSVYGLSEIFRDKIKGARLVANPGCYPTSILLALMPIRELIEGEVFVSSLSGVSGAGRKPRQDFHFPEMVENAFTYSPLEHRHTPEMEQFLNLKVNFCPLVAPLSRGILSNIFFKAKGNVEEALKEFYSKGRFVKVIDFEPKLRYVVNTNYCLIRVKRRGDSYLITSVIDNLGKGASFQAVQNMNLMFGFKEESSLEEFKLNFW